MNSVINAVFKLILRCALLQTCSKFKPAESYLPDLFTDRYRKLRFVILKLKGPEILKIAIP